MVLSDIAGVKPFFKVFATIPADRHGSNGPVTPVAFRSGVGVGGGYSLNQVVNIH